MKKSAAGASTTGDEVEAVKLFLTGDDGSSSGARVSELERGSEVERSKNEVRRGGGIYS